MAGNRYPVETFRDMARIPEEAVPRFLAELPEMLEYARTILALTDGAKVDCEIPAVWIDDEERTAEVSIRAGEEVLMHAKFKMPTPTKEAE